MILLVDDSFVGSVIDNSPCNWHGVVHSPSQPSPCQPPSSTLVRFPCIDFTNPIEAWARAESSTFACWSWQLWAIIFGSEQPVQLWFSTVVYSSKNIGPTCGFWLTPSGPTKCELMGKRWKQYSPIVPSRNIHMQKILNLKGNKKFIWLRGHPGIPFLSIIVLFRPSKALYFFLQSESDYQPLGLIDQANKGIWPP